MKRYGIGVVIILVGLCIGCNGKKAIGRKSGRVSTDIIKAEYHFGDVNKTHLKAAKKNGIKPIQTRNQIPTQSLVKIESCDRYAIDRLPHSVPYLTPSSVELLDEIGSRFQATLAELGLRKHRMIVTSVLRTRDDVRRLRKVNGNASANSAHQYATTFDITYARFERLSLKGEAANNMRLANILGNVLEQMRKENRCYVKYERRQRCFHITSRS